MSKRQVWGATARRGLKRPATMMAAAALVAVGLPLTAASAASVTPSVIQGNATCQTLLSNAAAYEIKVDPPRSGKYGPLDVTFSNEGKSMSFTSAVAVLAVYVKGGNIGGNLYDYRPGGSTGDTGLVLPNPQQISHVSFCWDGPPVVPNALTATKTATATYSRTVEWDLMKTVEPPSHSGQAGQVAGSSTWSVNATKTVSESAFSVTGTITVSNPNAAPATVSIADYLDDGENGANGTAGVVTCPITGTATGTVPGGTQGAPGTLTCDYTVSPSGRAATANNATVTVVSPAGLPTATALRPFTWTANTTGDDTVTLADPRLDGFSQQVSESTPLSQPEQFSCPSDPSLYTNGSHSFVEKNTATLTGEDTDLTRQASVTVNCTLPKLTASKTAEGTFDRVITWDLTKSVSPGGDSHSGTAGQTAGTSTWAVTATKKVENLRHAVSGGITIGNPAAIAQTFTVTDVLDNEAIGAVACEKYTLQPGEAITCTYTATGAGATLNTATVTAPGNADVTPTATVSYTGTTIGTESVTLADPRLKVDQTISSSTTLTPSETFTCPSDAEAYRNGVNNRTEVNTATISAGEFVQSASANVTVGCTLPALKAEKTATGSYDRTITWDLTKTVDPASHTGQAGQPAGSSTWSVSATKNVVENNNRVTGNIVIANPAAIAVPVSVSDMLSDGTVASVNCPAASVPAGGSLICPYTASPTGRTANLNTATVTGTGNTPITATAPVKFTPKVTGDESVTLADPRLNYSNPISGSTPLSQPETFSCPSDPSLYKDGAHSFVEKNTATLTGASTDLTREAEVTVSCTLPKLTASKTAEGSFDRVITWDLTKGVSPGSHSGTAGQTAGTSTWAVTATKKVENLRHAVSGGITISNPAAIAQTFTVTDVLDNNATGAVDCAKYTLAPGESIVCAYTATGDGAKLNTATVTAPGNVPVKATKQVAYTGTTIGAESVTLADPRLEYSKVISESTTLTPPETFTCPSDAAAYTNGVNDRTEINTATINGIGVSKSATANVTVGCTLPALAAVKTAAGAYDRVVSWDLTKTVTPASHSGEAGGEAGSSVWTVTATKSVQELGHTVAGGITVTNPASVAQAFTVTDVVGGKEAAVDCPSSTVPAGGQVVCTYSAAVADATSNTAVVTAPGNGPVQASAAVSYVGTTIGDDQVTLADPRFSASEVIDQTRTLTFPETFACPTEPAAYADGVNQRTETNTATLTGSATTLSRSAQVSVRCSPPEVLPTVVTPPPTVTPRTLPFVADPPRTLPRTGAAVLTVFALGSCATLLGALLVGATRRRRSS